MPSQRFDAIDSLRGVALVWMVAFHLCFDLSHLGFWPQDFYRDPVWTWQRTCILSLFLFCAGLGQSVALHQGQPWARFWRRWAQVAGCAALVTAGSVLVFPNSYIFFGVLHGIALMLLVARLTGRWGHWLWVLGALAIGSKFAAAAVLEGSSLALVWNSGWLSWLGWVTVKPVTEDYVPIFPWLGVLWWGMATGNWLLRARPEVLAQPARGAGAALAALGRWSLTVYMVHQPILLGILVLLARARA